VKSDQQNLLTPATTTLSEQNAITTPAPKESSSAAAVIPIDDLTHLVEAASQTSQAPSLSTGTAREDTIATRMDAITIIVDQFELPVPALAKEIVNPERKALVTGIALHLISNTDSSAYLTKPVKTLELTTMIRVAKRIRSGSKK
jgi:hypothetical protein